jgi:hypothetical protein
MVNTTTARKEKHHSDRFRVELLKISNGINFIRDQVYVSWPENTIHILGHFTINGPQSLLRLILHDGMHWKFYLRRMQAGTAFQNLSFLALV